MNPASSKLSPLQLELLKVYSFKPTELEMQALKDLLARFFAKRFTEKTRQAAEQRNINEAELDGWLEEDEQ